MASIKLIFKTRNRNRERIDKDAYLLHDVITRYSQDTTFTTYSNSLIIFNVYKVDARQRMGIVSDVCNKILLGAEMKCLNLLSYEIM